MGAESIKVTPEGAQSLLSALERHLPGKHNQLDHGRKKLAKLAALTDTPSVPPQSKRPKGTSEETVSLDRLRRVEHDAVMAMAEMAMDVEENVAKGASDKAIIHLVRSRMRRVRAVAIEKAGETVPYDPTRHEPMGPGIPAGTPVLVVRPGYVWELPNGPQVLKQPLVQD